MVHLFLCGPGGSGKTTLSDKLRCEKQFKGFLYIKEVARTLMQKNKITKKDIENYELTQFMNFQNMIVEGQCLEEIKFSNKDYISDRCIIDCLVYSCWKFEQQEGKLPSNLEHEILDGNPTLIRMVQDAVKRYQKSLIVLVHPWEISASKEDGTRLKMTSKQCEKYVNILQSLLNEYHIGFVDLITSNLDERVHVLVEAMQGKIKRNTCNLAHYKSLSKNKSVCQPKNSMTSNAFDFTNISFFLKPKIDRFLITVHFYEDCIELKASPMEKVSRFVHKFGVDHLASFHFHMKIRPVDVQKILLSKIFINGDQYSFLGCGSLKSRHAFLWKGTPDDAKKILSKCGDFEQISSKSKRMARVGLLFSSVFITDIKISDGDIVEEADIKSYNERYTFTDGCGSVNINTAKMICKKLPDAQLVKEPKDYLPSVFQIRLQGIKGVVALDPSLKSCFKIRPSMVKFRTKEFPYVSICDCSRPYTFGFLNRQLIYLLSGLGVSDDSFLSLQEDYFQIISNMHCSTEFALTILQFHNKHSEIEKISHAFAEDGEANMKHNVEMRELFDSVKRSFLLKDAKKINDGRSKEKLRILVKQSRFIYGVCDQSKKLEYGQCFLRLTIDGVPQTIKGKVVSARMPCYLLGDVKVLKAVDIPELHHLVDCVVFPVKGPRPHADEQAGGDLDGDRFFVTWEKRLIPPKTCSSHDYIAASSRQDGAVTIEKMIHYFSIQNEAMKVTGLLANLYEMWVDLKGAACVECERIGLLFGRAIDATKSGEVIQIPSWLKQSQIKLQAESNFVWKRMEQEALRFKSDIQSQDLINVQKEGHVIDNLSEEYIYTILQENYCNLTEFQKFSIVCLYARSKYNWKDALVYMEEKFFDQINFSMFSSQEKHAAIETGISPTVVCNSLCRAKVFPQEDLARYGMLNELSNWGLCYQSNHDQFNMEIFSYVMTNNTSTLICLRMPDDVILALQFHTQLVYGTEIPIQCGSLKAFLISKKFGISNCFSNNQEYYYDLVEDRFQIYRNRKKANSFLWLRTTTINLKENHGFIQVDLKSQDFVKDCLSVDLRTFGVQSGNENARRHPLINKSPFLQIEVFGMRHSRPSYLDIYVANEMDDIPEVDDIDETDDEKMEVRDTNEQLLKEVKARNKDEMSFQKLKEILEVLVATCSPFLMEPSEEVNSELSKLLDMIDFSDVRLPELICIMVCLSRLRQHSLVRHLSNLVPSDIYLTELLDVLNNVNAVWFIQPQILVPMVKRIIDNIASTNITCELSKYLASCNWNSFIDILNGLTLCKQDLSRGSIVKLRMDPSPEDDFLHQSADDPEQDENPNSDDNNGCKNMNQKGKLNTDEKARITFYRTRSLQHTSRSPSKGDLVIVMRHIDWRAMPNEFCVSCLASVIEVTLEPFNVTLQLCDKTPVDVAVPPKHFPSGKWMINTLEFSNLTVYTRVIKASAKLLENGIQDNLFASIRGNQPIKVDEEKIDHQITDLNPSQLKAVRAAMNSTVTLIQGPPGTGKTKVACSIIKEICKYKNDQNRRRILAVAETNTAVDNLCKRLLTHVKIVRVGNIKCVSSELYSHTLEGKLKMIEAGQAKHVYYKNKDGMLIRKKNIVDKILQEADVILATSAGAGDTVLNEKPFDFVLIDEATQTREPTSLCPLSHGAKQLVLIGDPKQLGPIVNLESCSNWLSSQEKDKVVNALQNTLFHRLHSLETTECHFLDTQYRMHPGIAEYPSKTFYDGKLKTGVLKSDRVPPWKFTSEPMLFINIDGSEKRQGTSYVNEMEADAIEKVGNHILNFDGFCKTQLCVLSLYKGQIKLIQQKLKNIEVNSIDGYQGRECEIVLVSTVRSGGRLGFSDNPNRLNVLLTRAKRGLIIIGHRETLSTCALWKDWIDQATSRLGYVSVDNFCRKNNETTEHQTHSQNRDLKTGRGGNFRGRGRRRQNFGRKKTP